MNREFLEGLGLEKDAINAIMAKHGSKIGEKETEITNLTNEKQKLDDKITQLENAGGEDGDSKLKERIKTLETEKSELETKIQQKDQEQAALKVEHAAERQAVEAKALDVTSVLAHVDLSEAELDEDGNVQGLAEKLESLSEEKTFLFAVQETQEPNKPKPWAQRGNGTVNKGGITKEQIMKTPDKRERQQLIQEHKDLF